MKGTPKRECPHCHDSLDRYEDPVAVKIIEKLERELAEAKLQLEDKTRLLRSIVPHAQDSDSRLSALREGVEKLAAEYTRLADTSDDEDFITEKRALARELRALLK